MQVQKPSEWRTDPEKYAIKVGFEINRLLAVLLIIQLAVMGGAVLSVLGLVALLVSYGSAYLFYSQYAEGNKPNNLLSVIAAMAAALAGIWWALGAFHIAVSG